MMTYPRAEQYSLAVQAPSVVFVDPELRASSVQRNFLGLPVCASGGFALTYHFSGPSGQWAVRCFKHEVPDREERYHHISAFLQNCNRPYLVTTQYHRQGILVAGKWYPITKLGWVNGESLGYFVERHLTHAQRLKDLARDLLAVVSDLESLGVAHGDLQHGNIRIEQDRLRLIDYDGMFVPSLAGMNACELGHRNYQHPRRSESHFDSTLDRFSSIVIYLALLALAEQPSLWNSYSTGGDNLLFRAEDFADPSQSRLLAEMERLSSVRELVPRFRDLCQSRLEDIPRLQDFLAGSYRLAGGYAPPQISPRPTYEVIAAIGRDLLLQKDGEIVEVVGEVTDFREGTTRHGRPYLFLNFGRYQEGCFTVVVWSEALTFCEERGLELTALQGKWVSVTGLIHTYSPRAGKGKARPPRPQIILEQPSQLHVFDSRAAAERRLARSQPKRTAADVFNALYKDRPVSSPGGPVTMARRPVQQSMQAAPTNPPADPEELVDCRLVYPSRPASPTNAMRSPRPIPSTQPPSVTLGNTSAPSLHCPSCGYQNPGWAGVCRSCRFHFPLSSSGHPLPTSPAPASPSPPSLWRRLCSWLTGQ